MMKDITVTSSATQKEVRALAHNLRSPRVNLPYCVRRHTAIPHNQNQYMRQPAISVGTPAALIKLARVHSAKVYSITMAHSRSQAVAATRRALVGFLRR